MVQIELDIYKAVLEFLVTSSWELKKYLAANFLMIYISLTFTVFPTPLGGKGGT